jgi:hypothetical protein
MSGADWEVKAIFIALLFSATSGFIRVYALYASRRHSRNAAGDLSEPYIISLTLDKFVGFRAADQTTIRRNQQ